MLAELAVKATVVICAAALAALALRRGAAALRHLAWLTALTALLLLPLTTVTLPSWSPALPQEAAAAQMTRVLVTAAARGGAPEFPWADVLRWAWGTVAAALVVRAIAAQARVAGLIARSAPYSPGVAICRETEVPLVAGLWRPVVLLPEDCLDWPPDRLELVLAHETHHARRLDPLAQFIAHLACALYWPLPWVWFAARRLRVEAELACDDGVIRSGRRASDYAGHLIDIVRGLQGREHVPQGGIPMARLNQLELRLRSLLAHDVNRSAATPRAFLAAAAAALVLLLPLSALHMPRFAANEGISGTVKDPSGAYVPKAKITVQFTDSPRREAVYTNDAGAFALAPLPDGIYNVSVAKPGFALLELKGIVVEKGESAPLELTLQPGKVRETLTVTAPAAPAPRAEPAAGEPRRLRVGGNVQAVKLIKMVRPAYPPECKAAGIEGTVMLRAVIGKDGTILNLEQVNQLVDRRLVDAAMEAVRQWIYQPTLLNGEPVEVVTEIEVNFTLEK